MNDRDPRRVYPTDVTNDVARAEACSWATCKVSARHTLRGVPYCQSHAIERFTINVTNLIQTWTILHGRAA